MVIKPVVVDLSHYDDVTDWDAVKAFGILGVISKASEGPGMVDKTYAIRRQPCAARGILYGAYHFMRPGDPVAQADHFLEVAAPDASTLLALDHEDPKVPLANVRAWLQRIIDRTGRKAILYSGFLIKQQLGRPDDFFGGHRLWLSEYGAAARCPPAWAAPWLWQYTGDGSGPEPHNVPGIVLSGSKGIDINTYAGSAAQLAAEWAS
jgi:lysozyme